MAASAWSFSSMAIFVKRLAPALPQFELVFFRSSVNLVWVTALMLLRREDFLPPGKPLLLFRGVAGFLGASCLFYSLSNLPMPVATMLSWVSPLFVILFSRLFLKERLPPRSPVFIPLAFAGLILLLDLHDPHAPSVPLKPATIGLIGAACGGLAYVAVRKAASSVGVNAIVFYFVAVSTLISAPLAARDFVAPDFAQWVQLLCLGTFATAGQLTMTQAYRHAPAGIVSMMSLLNPVFGAAIGLWIFSERLEAIQWVGMGVVGMAIAGLTGLAASRHLGHPRDAAAGSIAATNE